MKKILAVTLSILLTISVYGQNDIRDYFYPQYKNIYLESQRENIYDDYFRDEIGYVGNTIVTNRLWKRISGDKIYGKVYETCKIEGNMVVAIERLSENYLFGRTTNYDTENRVLLKLPPEKGITNWKEESNDVELRYTARFVIINVEIENIRKDIKAIKVEEMAYEKGEKYLDEPIISYWAKGYGKIIDRYVGAPKSGFYSTIITDKKFREVPYYDIEAKEQAEKLRKQREKQERLKKEQEAVNKFLTERETAVYNLKTEDWKLYEVNRIQLTNTIKNVLDRYECNDVRVQFEDIVDVSYDNDVKHNILITGSGDDFNDAMSDEIKEAVYALYFKTLTKEEPYTGRKFPVNATAKYDTEYFVSTRNSEFTVKKSGSDIQLLSGDPAVYNKNIGFIKQESDIKNGKDGKYTLLYNEVNNCGQIASNIVVTDHRRNIERLLIGYNYSKTAPVGIMLGLINVNYSKIGGVFISTKFGALLRSPSLSKYDRFMTDNPTPKFNYARAGITGGGVFSITNWLYLYMGLGYGHCAAQYSDTYSNAYIGSSEKKTVYYRGAIIQGVEMEAGVILRWKVIGVSVGYEAIPNLNKSCSDKFYGEVNMGLHFFIKL